jgi:hypothetical protein
MQDSRRKTVEMLFQKAVIGANVERSTQKSPPSPAGFCFKVDAEALRADRSA